MKKYILIGLAGALGAVLRTGIGLFVKAPLGTLIVNLLGAFLLCFLAAGVIQKLSHDDAIQDAIMTGFLGAFTTFSTLSMETVLLFETGQISLGILYVVTSLVGGMIAGTLGFKMGGKKAIE